MGDKKAAEKVSAMEFRVTIQFTKNLPKILPKILPNSWSKSIISFPKLTFGMIFCQLNRHPGYSIQSGCRVAAAALNPRPGCRVPTPSPPVAVFENHCEDEHSGNVPCVGPDPLFEFAEGSNPISKPGPVLHLQPPGNMRTSTTHWPFPSR